MPSVTMLICALLGLMQTGESTRGAAGTSSACSCPLIATCAATQQEARAFGTWTDAQSTTGPTPPPRVDVAGKLACSPAAVVISGVPAYRWRYGCGPTAAGMVVGYWDGHGFDALVPGDASTQTTAVNAMIATDGPASHYTDYILPEDDPDDHAHPLPDKSEDPPGDEHPDNCVADYMKTSQSRYGNYYGWSWFSHVAPALRDYVKALEQSGYEVAVSSLLTGPWGLNWNSFCAEIDAGRPMVLLVDSDGDGETDHFATAVGYDIADGVREYACLNTWDTRIHWFEFAPMASGQSWGVCCGVTLRFTHLAPTPTRTAGGSPTATRTRTHTPTHTGTLTPRPTTTSTSTATVTPTATASQTATAPGDLTLSGLVYDADGGPAEGIPGAMVSILMCVPRCFETTTAPNGRYSLLLPGPYLNQCTDVTMEAWAPGYRVWLRKTSVAQLRSEPVLDIALLPRTTATPTPTETVGGHWLYLPLLRKR